ncbi:S-layer homology domain-containing protein [Sinanaerobacter chloroacetimidivorans]|uniref:S-layer homology domain-containing protein n=1 Tax=Sinanaerobacter chloroacetimidivorans TaxID=2818044 RepID=A0A8J7W2V0_9FIRM|nr:S-layer homology domain-containing protein [Sinanaerobacter chloroacetimidivorans]MBR0599867.1 S-layer homology domain-containing protein [Sinanaerobacter chloroacetimidivorans]
MKRLLFIVVLIVALCAGTGFPYGLTAEAADLGTYSWAGEWETNWGNMTITQTGSKVTGTYTYDEGRINGTVSGNVLTGTWSEAPSYAPPGDAGEVEFVMSEDGKSFTGKWRYGSEGDWGNWEGGTRTTEVILASTPKDYEKASSWAVSELDKAAEFGLIPGILKGADMTKPITREEFAELAVKLYEQSKGTSAAAASPNPFTDTSNQQILKAFHLGITQGTSGTAFSPQVLINREQCAAMLFRTIKAIHPGGDYSTAGIPDFPDQKSISSYAVDAAKYMSKLNIVKGDAQGYFMPKAITSVQTAAGYGMATREAAVLMSVRTYDQMDAIKATSGNTAPAATSTSVVGTWVLGSLAGGTFNAASGKYEGGASGLGQTYTFKQDGTYTALVIWSNAIWLTGKYSVKDGVLTLTDRFSEESNDGGKTWGAKEALPDASSYFTAGTDNSGKYLLIGEEGAVPPLVEKANSLKYCFKE